MELFLLKKEFSRYYIRFFGIKILINTKKNHLTQMKRKLSFLLYKLIFLITEKTKKYSDIVILGRNCEIATCYTRIHGYIESSLFCWSVYNNKEKFLTAIKNPQLIFSEEIDFLSDVNMWHCQKTDIIFHGSMRSEELLDKDGNLVEERVKQEKENTISKIKHLAQKNQKIYSSNEKKLYILTLDLETKEKDFDFINQIYNYLKTQNDNFDMVIIVEEKKYYDELKTLEAINKNLSIKQVPYFHCNESYDETFDYYKKWTKILTPLKVSKNKIKTKRKLKCDD